MTTLEVRRSFRDLAVLVDSVGLVRSFCEARRGVRVLLDDHAASTTYKPISEGLQRGRLTGFDGAMTRHRITTTPKDMTPDAVFGFCKPLSASANQTDGRADEDGLELTVV
uniref:Transposase n=1 Tax=Steinernema glaseri TaxID=37863 RepID=A0A1I8ANJ6_9BILA